MSTFYTGRKRRALDGLRKTQSDQLAEVELGLNGLQRALAIEAGHDLHRIKLESFGQSTNSILPGGCVNIRKGAAKMVENLKNHLDKETIKLGKLTTKPQYPEQNKAANIFKKVSLKFFYPYVVFRNIDDLMLASSPP